MKCTNCNFENKESAKFCIKCGTVLEKKEKIILEGEKVNEIYIAEITKHETKVTKSDKTLQIALILGSLSFVSVLLTITLSLGFVLPIGMLSGIIGLIFTIKAQKRIKNNQLLASSRNVKKILYLAYFLNCFWILFIIILLVFGSHVPAEQGF